MNIPFCIPAGCRFYSITAFAKTWEAYDALTAEAGWTERQTIGDEPQFFKTLGTWPGSAGDGYITVHTPHEPRPTASADELIEAF